MDALELLKAGRIRISSPENWGTGSRGCAGRNRPMHTCCAAEAIEEALPIIPWDDIEKYEARKRALKALANAAGTDCIVEWNDAPGRTHAEVMAAYDLAIATLKLG